MTNVILRGKTYAGNSHVRFEEGNSASAEPRRNSLRLRKLLAMVAAGFIVCPLFGTLSDGLIAYYKFDGNANDSSGNEHHLTNVGAAKLVTGRKGDANGAYEFNGTSTSKLSADPAVVVRGDFSYSLWFQTSVAMSAHGGSGTAWNPGNDIIHSGFADYEYVGSGLRVGTDGLAIVEHGGMYRSTVFQYTKDIGINWHHVAVVVASGRGEVVYLDGEYVGEAEINDSTLTSFHGNGARAIHLEADGVGGGQWGYYTGCIDDLRIYNRTLSSAEVKALYDGDSAPEVTKCAVTSVTAQQRYPWNGLVDVVVTLQGSVENVAKADCLFAATNSATKAAIPVEHITRNGDDTGSGDVWMRKFIWDAKADIGAVKIDDVALTVDVEVDYGGVQLWENGPYWAECNVGAKKPEECGYYFWWGDTVGYERNANNDGWISVKDSTSYSFSDCPTYGKNNSQLKSAGYIDATGNLVAKYDAATAHLGAPWRMPTDAEFSALINNCDTEWTSRNGVSGRLVKGRGAYSSKSIFLPAAGYGFVSSLYYLGSDGRYWSSTPNSVDSYYAWLLYFDSGNFHRYLSDRSDGQSVRPVRGFASSSVAVGGVTTHLSLDCSVGTVSVTSVTAQQRYPWDGLVDVTVTMQGTAEDVAKADCLFAATNCATKAAIPVEHVTRNGDDTGSGNVWTRKFIWDAKADIGAVKIDDVALIVDAKILGGVQLWENGPYWAECNVGAKKPEECGYYFWWGDTVGYKRNANNDGWISVKDSTGFSFNRGNCPTYGKNNFQLRSDGYIDAAGNLVAKYDAATAHLGAPWRMPTDAEFSALINNCTTTWTTRNGVSGRLVTGKGAYSSKSIFLPAAGIGLDSSLSYLGSYGFYWSSTPYSDDSSNAWGLYFYSGYFGRHSYYYRSDGQSVRPVRGFASSSVTVGGVTTHLSLDCSVGTVSVTGVTARQRYPWNGLVDITVTLQGSVENVAKADCLFAATNSATKAAILVEHITRNGDDTGSGTVWTRKFIWDAKADIGAVKIDDVALAVDVEIPLGGVQLWENGPYWAECNVGATKPEECGYYFWWGDTVGYKRNANNDGWISVKDSTGFSFNIGNCPMYGKSNSKLQSDGYIDATGNLMAKYDAATAHLGAPWRMPTDAEFSALINNCDTEWTSRNGVSGRLVKGRGAYSSKSIFLPAAGYGYDSYLWYLGSCGSCWSSTPGSDDSDDAWYLYFDSGYFRRNHDYRRDNGQSVRPVRGFAK